MRASALYRPPAPQLFADFEWCQSLLWHYNAEPDRATRRALLASLLGGAQEGAEVTPPFRCEYGFPISIGPRTVLDFGCSIVDATFVRIGADCVIGPRVQIIAGNSAIDGGGNTGREGAAPVTIGDRVVIGAATVVCPGVTIGDDAVIAPGSVVTKNVPAGVLASGSPCRPERPVSSVWTRRRRAPRRSPG